MEGATLFLFATSPSGETRGKVRGMVRILTISFFLAVIFCPDKVLPYDPESRADLASRFSGYNFSRELELKEGSRFLCPSTFLTSERAILHERVLTSILGDKVGMNQKPTLFIVVGASGSGKSYLINSLIEGNGKTCPYGRPEDIGEFLFDGPRAKERNTFPVKAPKTILSVSGDAMMEKLPGFFYLFFLFFFFFSSRFRFWGFLGFSSFTNWMSALFFVFIFSFSYKPPLFFISLFLIFLYLCSLSFFLFFYYLFFSFLFFFFFFFFFCPSRIHLLPEMVRLSLKE